MNTDNCCCLCDKPLGRITGGLDLALEVTVLLYPDRPLSETHYGCAMDYWHNQEPDRQAEAGRGVG